MASQTPGAARAEGSGTSMAHQMAAGAVQMSHPRYDAHHQHGAQPHPRASADGVSNEAPSPHSYSQGTQNDPHYRYSLTNTMPPSAFPPFVTQKTPESMYNLQYSNEHSNLNPAQQPRQGYQIGLGGLPAPEPQQNRSNSNSNSSVDSGSAWPGMYNNNYADDRHQHQHPRAPPSSSVPTLPPFSSDTDGRAAL